MKALKVVAFVLGGLVVLAAVLLALALTPSIQTWAVRKAMADQPGMTLELDRVAAGFSAADIQNMRFVKDGMVVTAKGVNAKYSAWDYITKRRINADQVTIDELVVDLRNVKPATGPDAPTGPAGTPPGQPAKKDPGVATPPIVAEKKPPFEGVLKQAQLPFDIRVANLSAKGRALLPADQTVVFDLKGAGIETGQRGKLEWTVDFADAKKEAALQALRTTGSAGVHIAGDRRIDLVEVDAIAAAMGPKLPPDRVRLVARAEQPTAGGNEGYSANIALLRGNNTETILKTNAQYLAASREIVGAWEISLRTEQLAAVLAGLGLPELAANGSGRFNLKPDGNVVAASGDLQGQAAQLAKISPALEAVGAVNFKTTFDGGMADNLARLDKLELEVTGLDGRKFAQISSLQKVTYGLETKRVTLADPRAELARISLQAVPLAWAQPVAKPMAIESGDLSLVLAVEAEPDGSRVRVRAAEPLALRTVTVRGADKKLLADKVTLTVRPNIDYSATKIVAQLADLNVSTPGGDALTGNLAADVSNLATKPVVAFSTQLQGKLVTVHKPYLPLDPGALAVSTAVEGRQEGDVVEIAKATSTVNRENGALLNSSELLQPIRANTKAGTFTVARPDAAAARIRLGEIPLEWAQAFVPNSKFAGALTGAAFELTMRSMNDLSVNTTQPVALRAVTATLEGKPMVQALDITTDLSATMRGETIAYDVRRVELKQGDAALATINVAGDATLGKKLSVVAKGKLDADVAALMKQPVAAPFATLSRGRLATTFEASMADATQAKATISAKNLVAKQDNKALGDLDLTLTANLKSDGSGNVIAPITLTNAGRKSDVALDGTFGKATGKDTFLFTGKITGNQIIIDDFQALAALAPSGEQAKPGTPPAARPSTPAPSTRPSTPSGPSTPPVASTPPSTPRTPTPGQPTRDTQPFWKGVNGKVELDVKRLLYGKDYTISGVRGAAVITDTRLSLDGLEGRFKENPFKLAASVTFAAQQAKPYTLNGSADVNNFDVGEFLRAANPNEKPALETKATISAKLGGNGGTVADLAKNVFGRFELTGTKGTMYLLERKGAAGAAVNIASLGLAVLGAARGSDTTAAVAEIARLLNSVQFDSVKMQIERAPDLTFKLTSLEVISPFLRVTGSGTVASKGTEDLQNAPMNIVLQLGAKEQLGYLLQRVNMLGATRDEKGYQLMTRTFTIGGTPSKPDNNALWKILGEAALGALAR